MYLELNLTLFGAVPAVTREDAGDEEVGTGC
jgi:hypothetical protein